MAWQKGSKKRSLLVVNKYFEPLYSAASAASGINQRFLSDCCGDGYYRFVAVANHTIHQVFHW